MQQGWPLYRWFFFRFDGRVSRVPYFLGFMLLSIAQAFPFYRFMIVAPESSQAQFWSVIFMAALAVSGFSLFALTAKRLHDIGQSGVLALSIVVPVVSIIAFVYLCFQPGNPGPNTYGRGPDGPP